MTYLYFGLPLTILVIFFVLNERHIYKLEKEIQKGFDRLFKEKEEKP